MKTRQELLERLPKGSIGAELGVFAGDFSKDILRIVKPSKLYLVDLFEGFVVSGDQHGRNARQLYMETQPHKLKWKFEGEHAVEIVKSDSVKWLESRAPYSLDWIYIDTLHTYEHCRRELVAAQDVVKRNGFICGHDYCRQFHGVIDAVNEFSKRFDFNLELTDGDGYESYMLTEKVLSEVPVKEVLNPAS